MQLAGYLLGVPRGRSSLAPAPSRTVVGANARCFSYLGLDPGRPLNRDGRRTRFQDHGGAALAHASDVEFVVAYAHHLSRGAIELALVSLCGYELQNKSPHAERRRPYKQHSQPTLRPEQPSVLASL